MSDQSPNMNWPTAIFWMFALALLAAFVAGPEFWIAVTR